MMDIQRWRIWSLTVGRFIHDCNVDDVSDQQLHQQLAQPDNIRVEFTLRNAMELFERKGPDVAEIC